MKNSLTEGNETFVILKFVIPLIIGNLFQQLYNVVDSIIVGHYIGANALAAIGSSFTLMVFITSIIIGLCMGASVLFSKLFGAKQDLDLYNSISVAFYLIFFISILLQVLVIINLNSILKLINIPQDIYKDMYDYSLIISCGIIFIFFYNFFASVLRSIGNSTGPLLILILAAIVNISLDLIFITKLNMGIKGAAWATIIAQGISSLGSIILCLIKLPKLGKSFLKVNFKKETILTIADYSIAASIQQSIMNLGILMVQGLINSFGVVAMAGFTAAIKIESFAYMPMQEYGNAFSTFIAQNMGANKDSRIKKGIISTRRILFLFSLIISSLVFIFAPKLMQIFLQLEEIESIKVGIKYLRITAPFYILIGYLFSFYGYFRGIAYPRISILLTIVSLGIRVLLAYTLAPIFGLEGIWWSIPIGWLLADLLGFYLLKKYSRDNL